MLQSEALSILKTGANVFLTGEPGSGKTHTINEYVKWLRSHAIEPAITASTGIAATHIHGMTIHSWSGIGINDYLSPEALDAIASKEHVVKRIQKAPVLIIDEVSMLSANVLSMVDEVAREVRHTDKPFGGMQVVLVGDFFQLPPIAKAGKQAVFAFQSGAWEKLNPIICYLHEQHRQEDGVFLSLLSAIRSGEWDHTHVSVLTSRESDGDSETIDEDTPRLFTHNVDVDKLNDEKLAALSGKPYPFLMESAGGNVLVEALKRGCLSPERLTLKEGAIVMCTKNNPAAGYANGTLGIVTGFESGTNYPIIETRDGRDITMAPMAWAVEENGKVRAKISQVPLRLAWAITIHKSQGMSMDAAAMDLSRAFEYGQGYVALSRVRTLDGLHLLGWSEQALAIHPAVSAKDTELKDASEQAAEAFDALEESGEREKLEQNFIKASGGTLSALAEGVARPAKKTTQEETLALIEEGKTLEDIARIRSLTIGTICDHVSALAAGKKLDLDSVQELIPEKVQDALPAIHKAFNEVGADKLTPVFAKLKGKYSFEDIKLARVFYTK
ncbi:MAG: ATPase [Parcubacteria group bacterium]|nr:ATPase [Parcubacteria group bacterium]